MSGRAARMPWLSGVEGDPAGVRAALDDVVRQGLRPASWGLTALFAALTVGNTFLPEPGRTVMTGVAALSCLLFLALALRLRRTLPRVAWGHPLAAAMVLVVLANVLIHLALLPAVTRVVSFLLVIVATGFFFLDTRWLAAVLSVVLGSFVLVASLTLPPPVPWRDIGFWLFEATLLAGVLHVVRLRGMTRLVVAQMRDEAARRELETSNRELEAFTYSVSHDLRAPLRGIDYLARSFEEDFGRKLDPDAREYLRRIQGEVDRMGQLIEDLLMLSRISRGTLQAGAVDLAALAREVVEDLRDREPGRAVDVVVPQEVPVRGDPRLLRIVLENLLGNAWKYTRGRSPARIELGAREEGGARVVFVRDNGAGFDPSKADRLFQPFQRLHSAKEFEGTGIGLATVQRIIARHGGRVWAESGGPGKGATFSFTLPGP